MRFASNTQEGTIYQICVITIRVLILGNQAVAVMLIPTIPMAVETAVVLDKRFAAIAVGILG